jgi:hypothetical protein
MVFPFQRAVHSARRLFFKIGATRPVQDLNQAGTEIELGRRTARD